MDFRTGYYELLEDLDDHVDKYDKADKMFQLGYNIASFDSPFLRNFFYQNGNQYFGSYFWADVLDVRVLAAQYLAGEREKLPNFRLSTVAEYVGIPVEEERLHEAKYDLELTWKLYKKVTE
jgi:DNA polymerase-3 subunit epsilon